MPLHYVDPHQIHSHRYQAFENFGRSRPGQFMARHVLFRIDPWLYRVTGECQLGDEKFTAAEVSDPDEYARLYALAEQTYAGYGDYRVTTAHAGRRIPNFRLMPRRRA